MFLVLPVTYMLASTGVWCSLLPRPEDKLSAVGEEVTFSCGTTLPGKSVVWSYAPPDSQSSIVLYTGGEKNFFSPHRSGMFKVDTTKGSGRYDLVLKNVSMDQAGMYICRDNNGFSTEAAVVELVVLNGWSPNCTVTYAECHRQAGAGNSIAASLSCRMLFTANANSQITWSIQSTRVPEDVFVESYAVKTSKRESDGFADVMLQASLVISSRSSTARNDRSLTSTAVISYRPGKSLAYNFKLTLPVTAPLAVRVNVTEKEQYVVGDVIKCSAVDGPDSVTFDWIQHDNKIRRNSSFIVLDSEGDHNITCVARMGSQCTSVDVFATVSRHPAHNASLTPVTTLVMIVLIVSFAVMFSIITTITSVSRRKKSADLKCPEYSPNSPATELHHSQLITDKKQAIHEQSWSSYGEDNVYDVPDDESCPAELNQLTNTYSTASGDKGD